MENEKENKGRCSECWNCRNFTHYYTRGLKHFNKTKLGWCRKKLTETYLHESCEKFDKKIKRPFLKDSICISLSHILGEITEIHNVIKELINNEEV